MIDETNSCFDGLDRTFIDLSSKLAEPFCWAYGMLRYRFVSPLDPGKFDNTTSQVREIATRVLIFATAALAFAFAAPHIVIVAALAGAGSQIFRSIGFALQKDRFTHVRGLAPEKVLQNGQASTLVWGICGEYGGLSYKGGVVHWRSRLDKIVEKIETVDPDLIVLREIDDTALAEALIARLQGRYAHFFTHIAGSSCNKTNGCMVITKCAVSHFSHHELSNQAGFEMIELKASPDDASPCVRFMGTELNPAKECEESRVNQIAEIIHALAKETRVLPTFVVGTNAYRDSPKEGAFLSEYLHPSYRGEEPTHTDQLALQWDSDYKVRGKIFDFVSLVKRNMPDGTVLPVRERGIRMIDCHLIEAFDKNTYNTSTAVANRHGVLTTFSGLKSESL